MSEHSSGIQRLQPGWAIFALPACLAAALYLPSVSNQFVYDDLEIVVRNPLMHTVRTFPELVVSPYSYATGKLYRPLTSLTLGIDWVVGSGSPVMSHIGAQRRLRIHRSWFCYPSLRFAPLSLTGTRTYGMTPAMRPRSASGRAGNWKS